MRPKLLRNNTGMTLLEIMIVLMILSGLIAVLATQVTGQLAKARVREARIQMSEIQKALDMFYTDCGYYPSTEEGIGALIEAPSNCKNWGPDSYLKSMPKDPWGNEYIYEAQGRNPIIISLGEGGREGGTDFEADISSADER